MRLFRRCRHQWVEEHRSYHAMTEAQEFSGPTALLRELIEGKTIITYRCSECGRRSQDELRGAVGIDIDRQPSAEDTR